LLQSYKLGSHLPRNQEILGALAFKPKIVESNTILESVLQKWIKLVATYIEDSCV
jgi:hypothetical protein